MPGGWSWAILPPAAALPAGARASVSLASFDTATGDSVDDLRWSRLALPRGLGLTMSASFTVP